jgi:chaperonin GroEL (HSP60 family)
MITKEIDALFFVNFFEEKIVSLFKPKIILTNKKIDFPKFEKQKGDKLKVNLRKVEKLIFIFQ